MQFYHACNHRLSVGSSPTSGNAENLPQYDPGCIMGGKTQTLTFAWNVLQQIR